MQYPVSRWRKGLVPVFAVIHDSRMLTKEKEKEARRYEESGPWPWYFPFHTVSVDHDEEEVVLQQPSRRQ